MFGPAHPPGDRATTVVLVVAGGTAAVVARVDARRPDLALVDAILRLQLTARRRGCAVELRDVTDDLRALLRLVGVADVLRLEPCGQPEGGEHLGVQEVMESRDPLV
jgi:hypothetical protein